MLFYIITKSARIEVDGKIEVSDKCKRNSISTNNRIYKGEYETKIGGWWCPPG